MLTGRFRRAIKLRRSGHWFVLRDRHRELRNRLRWGRTPRCLHPSLQFLVLDRELRPRYANFCVLFWCKKGNLDFLMTSRWRCCEHVDFVVKYSNYFKRKWKEQLFHPPVQRPVIGWIEAGESVSCEPQWHEDSPSRWRHSWISSQLGRVLKAWETCEWAGTGFSNTRRVVWGVQDDHNYCLH